MADQGDAQIVLRAQLDGLNADIQAAVQSVNGMAGGIQGAAQRAGASFSSLSEKLREHRSEHAMTARAVGTFTRELEGLLGKGNETAAMLGSLAGGLAMGGGIGLAIEAVKVGFEVISRHAKESKESIEEFGKQAEESLKKAAQWAKAAADEFLRMKGFDPSFIDKSKELLDVQRQIDALVRRGNTSPIGGNTPTEVAQLEILRKRYADLKEQIGKYMEAKRGQAEIKADEEARKDEERALADRARLEEQFRQKDIAATKWVEDEKIKAMQDAAKRAAAILKQQAEDEQQAAVDEARRAWQAANGGGGQQGTPFREASADELNPAFAQEQARTAKKQAEQWAQVGTSISNSFARGFTNALFHAKSFEEGIKSVFDGILGAFEQMIEQMVAKLMGSIILSFLGQMIGGPVGGFLLKQAGGTIFGGGGGGGGGDVSQNGYGALRVAPSALTVNITAIDGASVRRVVESRDFQLALRGVARNT